MNAKTLEAIHKHGETLLRAFPHATEKDPVILCKKLRRIECAIARIILAYSSDNSSGITQDTLDHECQMALIRTGNLLGLDAKDIKAHGLFVNRDPRGYALKLDNEGGSWFKGWQEAQFKQGLPELHHDWGQYGIIAPDLTPEN